MVSALELRDCCTSCRAARGCRRTRGGCRGGACRAVIVSNEKESAGLNLERQYSDAHVYIAQSNSRRDGFEPCTAVMTRVWCSLLRPVWLKAVTLYSYWLALESGTWV